MFFQDKNSFPKEGWRKGDQHLPFFHSLPLPLAQYSLHPQNNTWCLETPHRNTHGMKWSFVFSVTKDFTSPFWPWLLSRYCRWQAPESAPPDQVVKTWDPNSWPWPQTFWLVTLSDLSNLLGSRTPSVWPPSLVSLPHPSLSGIMVLLLIYGAKSLREGDLDSKRPCFLYSMLFHYE